MSFYVYLMPSKDLDTFIFTVTYTLRINHMGIHVTHETWTKYCFVAASILHLSRAHWSFTMDGSRKASLTASDPQVLILLAGHDSAQLTAVQTVF